MQREFKKHDNQQKQSKQEERKQCLALWSSKNGKCLIGVANDQNGADLGRVIAFENKEKKISTMPDIVVYWLSEEGKSKDECVALWRKVSKAGNTYLSGQTINGEYVNGFYRRKDAPANAPLVTVYYQ